ncbi:MAG: flagellar basal-body rod protein FlgF [Peptococcaceae bacterium]|jgi:flagellar basal-body rod protein FlgG|nr:flagellar basal-body rod protein FlgF [Peptococcaceae bacterium]
MLRALGNGEAGMSAMQRALDTIANNLANLDTNGYKSQTVDFADLLYQAGAPSGFPPAAAGQDAQLGAGTRVAAIGQNLSQGNLRQTNRPLDLAIHGPGYFAVTGPGGRPLYTRDGHFDLNAKGQLVNSAGDVLAPGVTLPAGYQSVKVSGDGQVTVTEAGGQTSQPGVIPLYTFADPQGLARMGGNLYQATPASGLAARSGTGRIVQGSLEQSNVSLIGQMTDLITVERAYQFDSKAVQTVDAMWTLANGLYQ